MTRHMLGLLIYVCAAVQMAIATDTTQLQRVTQDHQQEIADLRSAMIQRLAVMPDVARYKWNKRLAINAPEREAHVIDATTKRATAMGLDPTLARRAITAQMEASKALQSQLFAQWRKAEIQQFDDVPSLSDEIRPMIDKLTYAFLETLGKTSDTLHLCSLQAALLSPVDGITPEIWRIATSGVFPPLPCIPDNATQE